jgi:CDP-glycerol glycerophosphotransferase (TagB/SpsB family)
LLTYQINSSAYRKKYRIKNSFICQPICSTKKNLNIELNQWYFINLFNYYFCFCKGINCSYKDIHQKFKYKFYLNIIDKNRFKYNKTDYLFADFIKKSYSIDDTYPVFNEMIKLNMPAHYMTEEYTLYNLHCRGIKRCLSILLVDKKNRTIDGDFLEKHLTLFLKLKATISGAIFFYIDNLFYNIDYITHICVGHGISILKEFLYAPHSYYGRNSYNKILLPPSKKIISVAKKRGWNEDDIIKINLPRWDKYNNHFKNVYYFKKNEEIKDNSIYIMFTWRQMKKNQTISKYYINNILKLISNKKLIKILKEKNIILYFTIHHKLQKYINIFKKNSYIKYIVENKISGCLTKSNLVVSDFSSIIFDFICRKKPYILFIPDVYEPQLKNIYVNNYYTIINSLKTGFFHFENVFLDLNETINKIIYYINNNFNLEKKLEDFYNKFSFKSGNNIISSIQRYYISILISIILCFLLFIIFLRLMKAQIIIFLN